jgi:3-oxoadipate enol-lactonase
MAIFASSRGALRYETLGAGLPVVLLHGFTNYGLSWAPQLPALIPAGYRVILPDFHGHGASEPATAACTVEDLVSDISALLEHLGEGPAILCGLSLGGMVAQQMAIARPDRVRGIVVANSRASFIGPALAAATESWIALFEQEDGPVKRLRATWPNLVNDTFRESAAGRAAFEAWQRVLTRLPGSSLSWVARGMSRFDARGRLAALRLPALVITGEHDRLFSPEQGREIANEIAGSSYAMIPGAGHLSSLDSADRFNRLLLDFLAAQWPAA